jgi:hypothetical protein
MSVAGTVKARKDGRALGKSVLHVIIVKTEGSPRVPPVFPVPGVVVITVGTFAEGEAMGVGSSSSSSSSSSLKKSVEREGEGVERECVCGGEGRRERERERERERVRESVCV